MSSPMKDDLERKFVGQLQEVYQRECEIMRMVLDGPEIGTVLINAVVGSILTTAATIAGMSKSECDPAEVYDLVINSIFTRAQKSRSPALQRATERHAKVTA